VVGTNVKIDIEGFTVAKRIIGEPSAGDPDGRYEACATLADYAVQQGWLTYGHLGLVSGDDYPDGEATVPLVGRSKGVVLMTKPAALPAAISAVIKNHGPEIKKIDFVGLGWSIYREVKSLNSARVTGLSTSGGPVKGGNSLVVTGSALNGASKVRVGKVDVPRADWKIDSADQITITAVPAGYGEGPVEVTVFNFWGASPASAKDVYFYGEDGNLSPGEKVVREAVKYLGTPYLWAGYRPSTGFDCSGFTMYVYGLFGISLPHYSATQAACGTPVAKTDLQPGDLVFYYTPISHVGMYVGGGMMINAPRSGDLVTIEDAFRTGYVKARRLVSPYARYEQIDSRLAYTGAWKTSKVGSASGGSFGYANVSGSSVTVAFNGTYLGWIAKKSPVYGKAKVVLDDKPALTVDLYSASEQYLQKVWNTGTLASGAHTVRIEWTGARNAAATGTNVSMDGLDLLGSLTQAAVTPPPTTSTTAAPTTTTTAPTATTTTVSTGTTTTKPTTATTAPPTTAAGAAATRYEQTDSRLVYAGAWATFSTPGASSGSYRRANAEGASVTVTFSGTYLAWIATRGTTLGKAQVSLDGGTPVGVNLAATAVAYKQKVWDTGSLASGQHTVKITRDATSPVGKYISVDALDVRGSVLQVSTTTPTPAAKPTHYEQSDTRLAFAGGWTLSSSASASGGNFRFANAAGSAVAVSFSGSYLSWIAKKSPVYGKAKVTLDGGAPVTVDLFSPSTLWRQKVWETSALTAGPHTVKIEWTGTKSSAATGTNINVDAFDVAGALARASTVPPARYEQKDAHFTYAGRWTSSSSSTASGGNFLYANSSGSSVTLTFSGSYLAWIAKKSPVYGKAKVTLDGGVPVVIDLYAASALWKQKVWERTLAPGTHTLKIEWTGTRNAAATGTNISVDAFDLLGMLP
jgi:cell wall-associated NlpC family hydrolase